MPLYYNTYLNTDLETKPNFIIEKAVKEIHHTSQLTALLTNKF